MKHDEWEARNESTAAIVMFGLLFSLTVFLFAAWFAVRKVQNDADIAKATIRIAQALEARNK